MHTIVDAAKLDRRGARIDSCRSGQSRSIENCHSGRNAEGGRSARGEKSFRPGRRSVPEQYISLIARLKALELIHEAAEKNPTN